MAIVVKSGFWNDSYSFINGNHPREKSIKRTMRKRGLKVLQELLVTLNGASVGGSAVATYTRVAGNGTGVTSVGSLGGDRPMETRTQLNRVTTSADQTRINNLLTVGPASQNIHDASGNGK